MDFGVIVVPRWWIGWVLPSFIFSHRDRIIFIFVMKKIQSINYVSGFAVNQDHHSAHFPYGWVLGSMGVVMVLILVVLLICLLCKSSVCFTGSHSKDPVGKSSHKFQILGRTSFCSGSGRYLCCKSGTWKQTTGDTSNHQTNIPRGVKTNL